MVVDNWESHIIPHLIACHLQRTCFCPIVDILQGIIGCIFAPSNQVGIANGHVIYCVRLTKEQWMRVCKLARALVCIKVVHVGNKLGGNVSSINFGNVGCCSKYALQGILTSFTKAKNCCTIHIFRAGQSAFAITVVASFVPLFHKGALPTCYKVIGSKFCFTQNVQLQTAHNHLLFTDGFAVFVYNLSVFNVILLEKFVNDGRNASVVELIVDVSMGEQVVVYNSWDWIYFVLTFTKLTHAFAVVLEQCLNIVEHKITVVVFRCVHIGII